MIRPIIVADVTPKNVQKNDIIQISCRMFDRKTMRLQVVSRIFMSITSTDGHVIWPLEVVRKKASGFDIGIGTLGMKSGKRYMIRISNNWNLSPSATVFFELEKSRFPILPILIPILLSPTFIRKYEQSKAVNIEELVEYLKTQGYNNRQITREVGIILKELDLNVPVRVPLDITRPMVSKQWITQLDHRVCPICMENSKSGPNGNGTWKWNDPAAPKIPAHPNCLLPDTLVQVPDGVITGIRSWYDGPVIEILTSLGSSLTVTPNHMFLTPEGFVAADFLREGDDVISNLASESVIPTINPNNNRRPTTIKEVFDSSLKMSGMALTTVPSSPKYLHNDGMFTKGNIDIVYPNSFLGNTLQTTCTQHSNQLLLHNRPSRVNLSRYGSLALCLNSLLSPFNRIMSSFRKSNSLFSTRLGHTQIHGFTSSSRDNTSLFQSPNDASSCNLEMISTSLDRFTSIIETDNIISINVKSYSGHVYDLQSPSTLYFGNNILLSNCRCTYHLLYAVSRDAEFRTAAMMHNINPQVIKIAMAMAR